ncbi:16S rRNA (cytosine(967)-C(5))-methyltransferase RsmB [Bacillus sp. HMF5848]|uniref:16S rRNA (cytosine(967)-C(5))-methyltransferase RsmB n=1 Tax=Bacillus sp. HMF5848 TaxID=2495421 RepID=UPI000F767796|nr:16S rRNA (cytosine(967)-C(5))-methyltransferase RsmB [Bacillus sp. HMF5848]RSK26978.1 16S rRNA (cytosine(967)-C(5))-methyltransferase RsmB [Bacillus sp. HMF5848]
MSNSNVREVALDALMTIEKNQAYSNLLLNSLIKKHKLSSEDIGLLTELVYGCTQRKLTLEYYLQPFIKNPKKVADWVFQLLKLSVYQLKFLDRVPPHAILFEAVEISKRRGHKGISSFVNGVLRNIQRQGVPAIEEIKDPIQRLSIQYSFPTWIIAEWLNQYSLQTTEDMCRITLQPPKQTARVNITRTNVNQCIEMLTNEGYQVEEGDLIPNSVKSLKGNLANSTPFKDGLLTIQDESSMLAALAVAPDQNDSILDSCAAPGGKTTHLAELLGQTGSVTSLDLHDHKVKLIEEQVNRLKLRNVTTESMDSRKVQQMFAEESFDKILVDAPCSGFGVIRRKPDIKYAKNKQDIERLAQVQLDILRAVAPLLKKGGRLVYSTCTIELTENEAVVSDFLKEHANFELDESLPERMPNNISNYINKGQVQILPHYFGTDGFFIASLRKQV